MKGLLIAEKPSLMREIQAVYNKHKFEYKLEFESFAGHTMELKKPKDYDDKWGGKWSVEMLPILPNNFEYKVSDDKKNLFKRIKDKIENGNYDFIVNACDPDREGEHIANSFLETINCTLKCKRFWTNDLTEESIKRELESLRDSSEDFFVNLKNASKLRARFDWLIGMNLTVLTSLKMKNTIKVGRVKTPTLKIIVDRENEINNFTPKTFYELEGIFEGYAGTYFSKEEGIIKFSSKEEASKIINDLSKEGFVESIEEKIENSFPPQLYTLNSLQSESNKIYGFSANKTRDIMQSLYEKKLLTYPRTDNPCISTQIAKEFPKRLKVLTVIDELKDYVSLVIENTKVQEEISKNKKYVNDKKMAESGHFAIIPTELKANLKNLSDDEVKILDMVYRRFLSIFLPPMKFSKTTIITNNNNYLFKSTGKILLDKGYSVLYKNESLDKLLPKLKENQKVKVLDTKLNEKITTPPSRYTEGTLLEVLENPIKFLNNSSLKDILKKNKGIGTTATRTDIISQLIKDEYIEIKKSKKTEYLCATKKGMLIIDNLKNNDISSVDMTGIWEEKLGYVEEGLLKFEDFSNQMIDYVLNQIKEVKNSNLTPVSNNNAKIIGDCPKCKNEVKATKDFYICSKYKNGCNFVLKNKIAGVSISEEEAIKILNGNKTKAFSFKSANKESGEVETFKARLMYSKEKENVVFVKDIKEIGTCPYCSSKIKETEKYFLCSNYKNNCNLCVPKVKNDSKITLSDFKKLIKGEIIEKEFTWKSGKKGKAKIKLENGYIKFLF